MNQAPNRKRRWCQFSLRTLLIGVTLLSAWFGWQLHVERQRKAAEADACEAVLRTMLLGSRKSSLPHFIALGMDDRGNWRDPPPGFLERFSDLGIRLRPASAAKLPGRDEKNADGRDAAVEDPATHARSSILLVKVERWIDDHSVQLFVEQWSGWLDSDGHRAIAEKRDGNWQVTKTFDDFVS